MKFSTIVADCPWRYGAGFKLTGGVAHHYPTLTSKQIKAIPVADVADEPCALFLWVVCPRLPEGIDTLRAWGFEYVTVAFTWVKRTPSGRGWHSGLGRHTNANAELVLLGRRGAIPRLDATVKQLVIAPVGRHSAKPEAVQDRIERLQPGPRLELFARRHRPLWTCTGLDLDGRDVRDAIALLRDADEPPPVELPRRTGTTLPLFAGLEEVAG